MHPGRAVAAYGTAQLKLCSAASAQSLWPQTFPNSVLVFLSYIPAMLEALHCNYAIQAQAGRNQAPVIAYTITKIAVLPFLATQARTERFNCYTHSLSPK